MASEVRAVGLAEPWVVGPMPAVRRNWPARLAEQVLLLGLGAITCVRAHWEGCGPSICPRVYFANHTSHCDVPLVMAALPGWLRERVRPLAASDYWGKFGLRRFLATEALRALSIDRSISNRTKNPLKASLDALARGDSLLVFPEGTRATKEGLLPFRSGLFHLAVDMPSIEIVPVWIDNAYRVLPKGAWIPLPLGCSVRFGVPLHVREGELREAFLTRARQALQSLGKGADASIR